MLDEKRLQELRTMPYQAYLQTPEWQEKRDQALESAGHRCQLCNSDDSLNVHHRSYERRGNEESSDLTVLCRACHSLFHDRVPTEEQEHGFYPISDIMQKYLEHTYIDDVNGIETGYRDLDWLLGGGFQNSDLILLGGRPGFGKTSLALNIALKTAIAGNSVAIFSLEMDKQQLIRRLLSMDSGIDLHRIKNSQFDSEEEKQFFASVRMIGELPIWISDEISTIDSMRRQLHLLIAVSKKVDFVIIDYIGLIEPDKYTKRQNSEQQIRAISRSLKLLAREFNIPVLVLCQLSREVERRADKTPQLSDLRDSGAQEQDADVVILMYKEDVYDTYTAKVNLVDVIVAKHRNGPLGETTLYFRKECTAFMDLEITPPSCTSEEDTE